MKGKKKSLGLGDHWIQARSDCQICCCLVTLTLLTHPSPSPSSVHPCQDNGLGFLDTLYSNVFRGHSLDLASLTPFQDLQIFCLAARDHMKEPSPTSHQLPCARSESDLIAEVTRSY